MKKLLILAAAALILGGCATSQTASNYTTANVMQRASVSFGTVTSVRDVRIDNATSGAGASAGMGMGAIAGSNMGGGRGALVGMIAGALIGGIAGHAADGAVNAQEGIEITYQDHEDGKTYTIVQQIDAKNPIAVGSRIRVLDNGRTVRAVLDT